MVFVVCVLYHGVNGTIGIVRDYAPKPCSAPSSSLSYGPWLSSLVCSAFATSLPQRTPLKAPRTGTPSTASPKVKKRGNPPNFLWKPRYDFGEELRELNLLNYYLEHHTVRTEENVLSGAEIFNGAEYGDDTHAGGTAFDTWALGVIATGFDAHKEEKSGHRIFSSTYEFARWAVHIRKTNAEIRLTNEDPEVVKDAKDTLQRLADAPNFDVNLH